MMTKTKKDLLDILLELKSISRAEAEFLRRRYPSQSELGSVLITKGVVSAVSLAKAYALLYGLPFIHLIGKHIPGSVLRIIPSGLAERYQMVAYDFTGTNLKIAVGQPAWLHPSPSGPLHNLAGTSKVKVELAVTTPADITWASKGYERGKLKPNVRALPAETVARKSVVATKPPVPFVDIKAIAIPAVVLAKFPEDIARKYQMVVFEARSERHFKVAAVNPDNPKLHEIIKFLKERNEIEIELYRTDIYGFEKAMAGYARKPVRQIERFEPIPTPMTPPGGAVPVIPTGLFGTEENDLDTMLPKPPQSVKDLEGLVGAAFVPKLVAGIIALATKRKASDIHLEPSEKDFRLRYRIDGVLQEVMKMPLALQPPVISRVKILSRMKIDEQRIPQDGRFDAKVLGHQVDIRVSSLPTVHGEKVAMRLLDKSAATYTLQQVGLAGRNLKRVLETIAKPFGILLVTGPTGSGKTTTLYAILIKLLSPKVNIITLEDPVEYEIPGVNQTQVKPKIGFSFAEGLRSVLRQDPNIIMVGEVRDGETASLVTHAALTGHLVLTTLHTNDAAGALPRLINMGIEPYLITSAVNAVIAQRLVRRLCPHCRKPTKVPETVLQDVQAQIANLEEAKAAKFSFYEPVGCEECTGGFSGRLGIFEVLKMSEVIEQLAINRQPADAIKEASVKQGMITIRQDGLLKAAQGLTTIEEVYKVTSS